MVEDTRADKWIGGKIAVTCPLSELGFLRISTHPKAIAATMADARKLLDAFVSQKTVEFLPDSLPALKSHANSTEEVTDRYLADAAAANGMKLATFAASIKHPAVHVIA